MMNKTQNKHCKTLIVLVDAFANRLGHRNIQWIVTKHFLRSKEITISLVFIAKYYYSTSKKN